MHRVLVHHGHKKYVNSGGFDQVARKVKMCVHVVFRSCDIMGHRPYEAIAVLIISKTLCEFIQILTVRPTCCRLLGL